jgi:hypothetical protein
MISFILCQTKTIARNMLTSRSRRRRRRRENKKKTKNGRRKEDFSTPTSLVMLILQGSPNGKSKEIVDENKYI